MIINLLRTHLFDLMQLYCNTAKHNCFTYEYICTMLQKFFLIFCLAVFVISSTSMCDNSLTMSSRKEINDQLEPMKKIINDGAISIKQNSPAIWPTIAAKNPMGVSWLNGNLKKSTLNVSLEVNFGITFFLSTVGLHTHTTGYGRRNDSSLKLSVK